MYSLHPISGHMTYIHAANYSAEREAQEKEDRNSKKTKILKPKRNPLDTNEAPILNTMKSLIIQ